MSEKSIKTIFFLSLVAALTACGSDNNNNNDDDVISALVPPDSPTGPIVPSPITNLVSETVTQDSSGFTLQQQSFGFADAAYTVATMTTTIDAFFPDEDTQVAGFMKSLADNGFDLDEDYQGAGKRLKRQAAGDVLTVQWEPVASAAYQMIEYKLISQNGGGVVSATDDNLRTLLPKILVNPEVGVVQKYTVDYLSDPNNPVADAIDAYMTDLETGQGFNCELDPEGPVCQKFENDDTRISSVWNFTDRYDRVVYYVNSISNALFSTTFAPNNPAATAAAIKENESGTIQISRDQLLRALLPENADGLVDDAKLPAYEVKWLTLESAAPAGDSLLQSYLDTIAGPEDYQPVDGDPKSKEYEFDDNNKSLFVRQTRLSHLDVVNMGADGINRSAVEQVVPETMTLNPNFYHFYTRRWYPIAAKDTFGLYLQRLENAGYQRVDAKDGEKALIKSDLTQGIIGSIEISESDMENCVRGQQTQNGLCVFVNVMIFQPGVYPALMQRRFAGSD